MNYNEFYAMHRNTYPQIQPRVYVHQSKDDNKIVGFMDQSQVKHTFEKCGMLEINNDAVYILQLCDGSRNLNEIIQIVAKEKYLSIEQANAATCSFISNAVARNFMSLSECQSNTPLELTGSKDSYWPIHFVLELTTRCNLKCKHCYRSAENTIKETELTFEEVIRVIDSMYDSGARFIEMTGGEVMMHPRGKDIIRYVCQKFYFVGILTNGVLLEEDFIAELEPYKDVLIWSISLDSYKDDFHNSFRGSQIAFKKTTSAIKALRKHGHLVRVSMSIVEGNFFDVEETMEYAKKELDATWFGFNMVMPYGRGKELEWHLDAETTMKRAREIDNLHLSYEKKYPGFLNSFSPEQLEQIAKQDGNCGAGWRTVTISPAGNVRPCVMGDEKYVIMGNILNDGIDGIVKKGHTELFRNIQWPEKQKCGSCPDNSFCHRCALRAYIANEERVRQGTPLCKWAQENRIEKYINLTPTEQIQASGCKFSTCNEK